VRLPFSTSPRSRRLLRSPVWFTLLLTATIVAVVLGRSRSFAAGILIELGVLIPLIAACFVVDHFFPSLLFEPREETEAARAQSP
jgi:hypothetical protein